MDLYRQEILDHYKHPHNFGSLDKPDSSATLFNTSCGDKITMEVQFGKDKKTLERVLFSGEGCAISIASASMLTDAMQGKPITAVMDVTKEMVLAYIGADLTPSRIKCALLPLEALQQCVLKWSA